MPKSTLQSRSLRKTKGKKKIVKDPNEVQRVRKVGVMGFDLLWLNGGKVTKWNPSDFASQNSKDYTLSKMRFFIA